MIELDRAAQRWVVTHRVDALDPVFVALSWVGSWALVWLVLALAASIVWRRAYVFPIVAATVLLTDWLTTALKHLTDRPRPYVVRPDPEPLVTPLLDRSFPSGHASTSFAAAALLAWFGPRYAGPLYALAAAIAASRVYVGVHYPSDVVAGALLGTAIALTVRFAVTSRRGLRQRMTRREPGASPARPP